jgi:hypothetical protein
MKGKFLIVLLLWGGVDLPAQTIVQHFAALSRSTGATSDLDVEPTGKRNVLIAMPGELSPGAKVVGVTDNAPDGGNTYKQVPGASSSCGDHGPLDIWFCENCNPGVTELKFHISANGAGSINSFLEVSNLALSSVMDGSGAQVSNGTATSAGVEVGPRVKTTSTDFIVARFFSDTPYPTGVAPEAWTFEPSYVYLQNAPPGTYQPTLTGAKAGSSFCMSVAAFKIAPSVASPQTDRSKN